MGLVPCYHGFEAWCFDCLIWGLEMFPFVWPVLALHHTGAGRVWEEAPGGLRLRGLRSFRAHFCLLSLGVLTLWVVCGLRGAERHPEGLLGWENGSVF
jgi:hypothetical protein